MRRTISRKSVVSLTILALSVWFQSAVGFCTDTSNAKVTVHFSPNGGCTKAITAALSVAKQSIHVQAYSFTSAPIAKALVEAHRRRIKVQVILDSSQRTDKYSSATFLNNMGVPVLIDDEHAIAHNKIIIIDGQAVITGSFNFSKAAEERNAENVLIIEDPKLAARYMSNWVHHSKHSVPYQPLTAKK